MRRVAERSIAIATTDRAAQLERVKILRWYGECDPDWLRWLYVNELRDGKLSWFVDDAVARQAHAEACARDGLPRPTQSALKQAAAVARVRERTRHGRGLAAVGDGASDDVAAVAAAETTTRQNTARENRLAQSHGRSHFRPYGMKFAPLGCCTGSGVALEARFDRTVTAWCGGEDHRHHS